MKKMKSKMCSLALVAALLVPSSLFFTKSFAEESASSSETSSDVNKDEVSSEAPSSQETSSESGSSEAASVSSEAGSESSEAASDKKDEAAAAKYKSFDPATYANDKDLDETRAKALRESMKSMQTTPTKSKFSIKLNATGGKEKNEKVAIEAEGEQLTQKDHHFRASVKFKGETTEKAFSKFEGTAALYYDGEAVYATYDAKPFGKASYKFPAGKELMDEAMNAQMLNNNKIWEDAALKLSKEDKDEYQVIGLVSFDKMMTLVKESASIQSTKAPADALKKMEEQLATFSSEIKKFTGIENPVFPIQMTVRSKDNSLKKVEVDLREAMALALDYAKTHDKNKAETAPSFEEFKINLDDIEAVKDEAPITVPEDVKKEAEKHSLPVPGASVTPGTSAGSEAAKSEAAGSESNASSASESTETPSSSK